MASSIFTPISIPEFKNIIISEKQVVSTSMLYTPAKEIFKSILVNYFQDERLKKKFTNKSSYTSFLHDFCRTQKYRNSLKKRFL